MKIKYRINLIFSLLFLAIFSFFSFLNYRIYSQILQEQIVGRLSTAADSRVDHINTYFEQNIERIKLITSRTKLRETLFLYNQEPDKEKMAVMSDIIKDAKIAATDFERICILDNSGAFITSTDPEYVGDCGNDNFIGQDTKSFVTKLVFEDNQILIMVKGPFIYDEEIIGSVVAAIDTKALTQISNKSSGLGETGEILLAIRGEDQNPLFITERKFQVDEIKEADPMKKALRGQNLSIPDSLDYRGVGVISAIRYIESVDLGIVAKIDRDEAFASSKQISLLFTASLLGGLITFYIFSLFLAHSIARPIEQLSQDLVAEKEDVILTTEGGKEIKQLVAVFNDLRKKTIINRQKIEEKVAERTESLEKLNKAMVGRELKMMELKKQLASNKGAKQ